MNKIYNRKTKQLERKEQFKEEYLKILYHSKGGRILLKFIICPLFSRLNGFYNDTGLSKKKINPFIQKYKINIDEFEKKSYESFGDFFIRKIKPENRPLCQDKNKLISPADSKLLVYNIKPDLTVNIKDSNYTLHELLGNRMDLEEYKNGLCLVFRLSVDDYHRYCYIDSGEVIRKYSIKGKLHTVSSISKDYKIFKENSRVINILKTTNFGEIICIEVGALLVGKIVNRKMKQFKKGQEKGYFKLGGSTIVIIIKGNQVKIDEDIIKYSQKGIETKVNYREIIGEKV